MAPVWFIGRESTRSGPAEEAGRGESGSMGLRATPSIRPQIPRVVWTTGFGVPVVPEVQMTIPGACGSRRGSVRNRAVVEAGRRKVVDVDDHVGFEIQAGGDDRAHGIDAGEHPLPLGTG